MKETEQSNNAQEGIPLQPNPSVKKGPKICDCTDSKNPCLHFLARTAQHDKLKAQFKKTFFSDDLLAVNKKHRTILHCAANYTGDPRKANKCVELILEEILRRNISLEDFVNAKDEGDLTALYLSVKNENTFVCKTLIQQGGADLDIESKRRKTAIQKLFKKMPVVIENFLELVADSIKYTDDDLSTISVDLGLIIGYPTAEDIQLNKPSMYEETDFLSNLCYTPIEQREPILTHPVVKAFVHLKWRKIESLFWIARAFQITWALAYFWFVMEVYRKLCPYPASKQFKFTWLNFIPVLDDHSNITGAFANSFVPITGILLNSDTEAIRNCRSDPWINVMACVLLTLATFDLLYFEIHPTFVRFRRYWYPMKTINMRKCFKRALLFLRILHLEKMFLLFTIFLNVIPLLVFSILDPLGEWQYISASLGVFLTWVHVFFQVGKIPQLTVYVRMLEKVLSTLSVITLIYVSLIYAFGMVFCILLPASYSSPFQAILKMTTFLIGEVEYESFFYEEHSSGISVSLSASMLFYGIAILVLHIALLNFLVGLTVADVQNVDKYAEVWKSFRHVWEISLLESFLSRCPAGIGFPLLRKIALQKYDVQSSQIDASESGSNESMNHEAEIRLEELPKPLRKEIRKIILDRENREE